MTCIFLTFTLENAFYGFFIIIIFLLRSRLSYVVRYPWTSKTGLLPVIWTLIFLNLITSQLDSPNGTCSDGEFICTRRFAGTRLDFRALRTVRSAPGRKYPFQDENSKTNIKTVFYHAVVNETKICLEPISPHRSRDKILLFLAAHSIILLRCTQWKRVPIVKMMNIKRGWR